MFDPTKHKSPKFDIYGLPLDNKMSVYAEYNNGIDSKNVKIPKNWSGPHPGKTRTQLKHEHRSEFIPHPSYDVDGDGIVGGRDLAISKMFDKDKDGILNPQERKNAMEALKSGYEK